MKHYYNFSPSKLYKNKAVKYESELFSALLENFNSIETFTKIRYFIYALTWPDSSKIVLSGRIRHFKKIMLKGREFRGGSD